MRYRAQEKAYLTDLMNNPKTKAELRLEACERHEKAIKYLAERGAYRHLTVEQFVFIVIKEHSDTIDEWFDRDGWKR
jgi:hypothetical protein